MSMLIPVVLLFASTTISAVHRQYDAEDWDENHSSSGESEICDKYIDLSVYYDSKCRASQWFIAERLLPLAQHRYKWLRIHMIPYGLAELSPDGAAKCSNGPDECLMDRIQVCSFKRLSDKTPRGDYERVALAKCILTGYSKTPKVDHVGRMCTTSAGLSWDEIKECADGKEGKTLEKAYLAKALRASIPRAPYLAFNNNFGNEAFQMMAVKHLAATVRGVHCREITVPITLPPPVTMPRPRAYISA